MAKVISAGGLGKLATAGALLAAGAAVNRLFRPFGATAPLGERMVASPVLTFPISPLEPLDRPVPEPVRALPAARPTIPARPARSAPALLTRRGAARKAWRCV